MVPMVGMETRDSSNQIGMRDANSLPSREDILNVVVRNTSDMTALTPILVNKLLLHNCLQTTTKCADTLPETLDLHTSQGEDTD